MEVVRHRAEVAIVMPIKNSQRFIREALDSVVAQTVSDYQVIVVDGGSTDEGPAIARSYPRTVCIPQQATGLADAWNTGIAAARAPFIAFLDSDDLWTPEKLSLQLGVFGREPELECVFGRTEFFVEPGEVLPRGIRPGLLAHSHLTPMTGSSMIRRPTVDRLGPFDADMRITSDIAWFARLRESSLMRALDRVVLRKRLHADSLGQSAGPGILESELLRIARQRVEAQRQAGARDADRRTEQGGAPCISSR